MSIDVSINGILLTRQAVRLNLEDGGAGSGRRILLTGSDHAATRGEASILVENLYAGRMLPVAIWPSATITLGTSYADIFTLAGEAGLTQDVDFMTLSEFYPARLLVWWNVTLGLGTHTVRAVDAADVGNVLGETAALSTGRNTLDFTIPSWATVAGERGIKLQAKSTSALDTAILRSTALLLGM